MSLPYRHQKDLEFFLQQLPCKPLHFDALQWGQLLSCIVR
jgi:hypothetical protein